MDLHAASAACVHPARPSQPETPNTLPTKRPVYFSLEIAPPRISALLQTDQHINGIGNPPPLPPQMASETQRHASRLHARLASPTLPVLLRRAPGRPRLSALLSSMALVLVAGGRGRRRRHDRPAVQGQGGQPVGEMYVLRADARGVAAEACVVSDVGRLKAREILHVIFTYQRQ